MVRIMQFGESDLDSKGIFIRECNGLKISFKNEPQDFQRVAHGSSRPAAPAEQSINGRVNFFH